MYLGCRLSAEDLRSPAKVQPWARQYFEAQLANQDLATSRGSSSFEAAAQLARCACHVAPHSQPLVQITHAHHGMTFVAVSPTHCFLFGVKPPEASGNRHRNTPDTC